MFKPICEVHTLGLIDYQRAWDLQNQYAKEIAAGDRPPTLLLLEHPHTYTFGRRGNASNLLWGEDDLHQRGVTVYWVDRGGDVTYHGPGQLVGYPLLPLGNLSPQTDFSSANQNRFPKVDYVGYIRKLEQVIISAIAKFGMKAKQVEGLTGVWVGDVPSAVGGQQSAVNLTVSDPSWSHSIAKLAAIGVKVDARGISRHGFALNVDPDMRYWEGIIGCGLPYPEISLADLIDPAPSMEDMISEVLKSFGEIYGYKLVRLGNT